MANIRIDLEATVIDGQALTFKSPVDCSQITGLIIYYPVGETKTSKVFQFADAHGNNVGSVSLFAANVLVKVILDTALNRAYVQNADTNKYIEETFLKRSGGTMTGPLAMGSQKITGLATPTADTDAVTKKYADDLLENSDASNMLPKSGGTMTGAIAMGCNKITGLGTPTADADASTKKYVDDGLSGKAASSHNHSAENITSGTLPLERGGTNSSADLKNAPNNAVITKLNNDNYNQLYYKATANGALYATAANGSLIFGTLPIKQGGTGATTAEKAKENLGIITSCDCLWRNSSWTSAFNAQTLTISSPHSPSFYRAIIVTFMYNTSYGYEAATVVMRGGGGTCVGYGHFCKGTLGEVSADEMTRGFIVHSGSVQFFNGFKSGVGNSTSCVPMSIWGINW